MPAGLTNPSQQGTTTADASDVIGFGDYIDRQLNKVRAFVRLSDLAVAITTGAVLVCALLFVLILVDHWLFDLGRVGRGIAFAAILGIVGYFSFAWILPLIVKRMNPAYVAHVIEQGEPALKNGLLNFVLFRAQPHSVRKVILEAVERRAAVDLSRINVDTSIDRTPLIRIGVALGALLIGMGLYAVFSPKDPLQTIARVLTPWSNRARPSRVQIIEVEPGSTTVYAGRQLAINATIENLSESEGAAVVYSTPDGQVVDAQLAMLSRGNDRWTANLPEATEGLQQDVTYLISAGDAVAGPFRVNVLPSPSIVANQLDYDYPDYTGRESMVVERAGNIDALEGTRVTVHATANQDIDYAYIEFDALDNERDDGAASPRQTLTMKHKGRAAWSSFTLLLQPDRRTPWHLNYQVRFRNLDGATNDRPVRYDIRVTPDIPPLVEILTPTKREVDLPLDATQWIEVRAVDPDYGLAGIGLRAVKDRAPLLDEDLLARRKDQTATAITGQQVVKHPFTPGKFDLRPGDVVVYWARASDNRVEPGTTKAAPNLTKTQQYRFRITAPRNDSRKSSENGQSAPTDNGDKSGKNNGEEESNKGDSEGGARDSGDAQDQQNGEQRGDSKPGNDGGGSEDDQQGDEPQEQQAENEAQDKGQASGKQQARRQQNEEATSQRQNGDAGGQEERNGTPKPQGSGEESQDQASPDDSQPNEASESGTGADDRNASGTDRENNADSENTQSRQATGDEAERTNTDDAARTDGQQDGVDDKNNGQKVPKDGQADPLSDGGAQSAESDANKPRTGEESTNSGEDPASQEETEPLPNDGSRDGDAMERILKQIRERTGKKPEDATSKPCDKCSDGSCDACQQATEGGRSGNNAAKQGSKSGQPSAEENGSQTPRSAADSQRNTKTQEGDSQGDDRAEKNGSGPEGQNAGGANEPGEATDSPPSKDGTRESGNGASAQSNADDTGDQDESTDSAPSEDPNSGSNDDSNDKQDSAEQDPNRSNDSADSQPNGEQGQSSEPNGAPGSDGQGATDPNGNASSSSPNDSAAPKLEDLGADEANLEYTRKATDLVLEYLEDQKNRRDGDLLDKLGWSPEELEKFRQRWEQMKREAEQNDPVGVSAQNELDEVLRSLGLTPRQDRIQAAGSRDDSVQVRNTGRRSKPPASYRGRYERFLKSVTNQQAPQ